MHDDHANQLLRPQAFDLRMDRIFGVVVHIVGLIDQEGAWVQGMLAKSTTTESVNSFKVPAAWCIDLSITGLQQEHSSLFIGAEKRQGFSRKLDPQLSVLLTTLKKAVLTSAVQVVQPMVAPSDRTTDLESRVVVGLDVSMRPARASGSANPRTMRRALARGVPSGLRDHLSKIRDVSVLAGSASFVVSKTQT